MIGDYLLFALNGIRNRKLRSWLTMLGIFVGIMSVVAIISLGEGLQKGIDETFQEVGYDRIIILPGGGGFTQAGGAYTSAKLTDDDLETVRDNRGVDFAIGIHAESMHVEYEGEKSFATIWGARAHDTIQDNLRFLIFLNPVQGRYLKDGEANRALIGVRTSELFGTDVEMEVGDTIKVKDKDFRIVGVTEEIGDPNQDAKIVIPLETHYELLGKDNEYSRILAKVESGFAPSEVAESLEEDMRKDRGVEEDEEDFTVQTLEDAIETVTNILAIVQAVLSGIAAISLVVGSIGIMTTMYTSVIERTKQIGIMKAVGAKNSDIQLIFMMEAGILGLIGGTIGIILGGALSYGITQVGRQSIDFLKFFFPPELVVATLTFSFIIGSAAGFFPARQAAGLQPVEALRK